MKLITLNEQDFDTFANTHKYKSIYQTSSYKNIKELNGFKSQYLGILNNNNELIGASLILYKTIYLGYKYAYAPCGFLIDYNNYDNVKDLTDKLKKMLYKQKFMFFTIDPRIILTKRNIKNEVIEYNPEANNILNILKKCNYKHKGFNNRFENNKARWQAITELNKNNDELYYNLNKQTRNKISKANKSGIVIYKADNSMLPTLYEFIKRKDKKDIKHYEDLINCYKDNIEIYLAKIEPERYVRNSKYAYERELSINEALQEKIQDKNTKGKDIRKLINKKMESDKILNNEQGNLVRSTRLFQDRPNGVIIGGAIVIKQNDTVNLYIEGFNKKYNEFNPNYLLKWELIKKFNNEGYKYFNLNGITGEFKNDNKYSGLNEMKLGFAANAYEYIGEFDFIINKFIYKLYQRKKSKNK